MSSLSSFTKAEEAYDLRSILEEGSTLSYGLQLNDIVYSSYMKR